MRKENSKVVQLLLPLGKGMSSITNVCDEGKGNFFILQVRGDHFENNSNFEFKNVMFSNIDQK